MHSHHYALVNELTIPPDLDLSRRPGYYARLGGNVRFSRSSRHSRKKGKTGRLPLRKAYLSIDPLCVCQSHTHHKHRDRTHAQRGPLCSLNTQ